MSAENQAAVHKSKKTSLLAYVIPVAAGIFFVSILFLLLRYVVPSSESTAAEESHLINNSLLSHPRIEIKSDLGSILIELYPEHAAPVVKELITLTKSGYYNNSTFMESMPPVGFVIAKIGPAVKVFKPEAKQNTLPSVRGSVAISKMTPGNAYLNNIFIGFQPQQNAEQDYIIFGKVLKGLDLVEKSQAGVRFKIKSFNFVEEV